MKYHALFFIFEKAAKFEIVVTDGALRVKVRKVFELKNVVIFLPINLIMCCGCSKTVLCSTHTIRFG